jgi:hypothetical protein
VGADEAQESKKQPGFRQIDRILRPDQSAKMKLLMKADTSYNGEQDRRSHLVASTIGSHRAQLAIIVPVRLQC